MDQELKKLNERQRCAVTIDSGPLLVLAGAGTGKTRTLTARIAWLIREKDVQPYHILAVTFTRKAAREMRERLGATIGEGAASACWLGTFHAICARLLRLYAALLPVGRNFVIIDARDSLALCKKIIQEANLDPSRASPALLAGLIDSYKNEGYLPEEVPAALSRRLGNSIDSITLYARYQKRLQKMEAVDYGDLLLYSANLLQHHAHVREACRARFRHVFVDEYQDTNTVQYLWLRLLAGTQGNLCCVGDDDQSIYGWRGAKVDNILRFEKDFPGARTVRLEQNYRSTSPILACADSLIQANKDRLGKSLWTKAPGGDKVQIRHLWDHQDEATFVISSIRRRTAVGSPASEMAILVRVSAQMRIFEEMLNKKAMPYRIVGGPRFYDREEIRDALAFLRLIANRRDDAAFLRIVNKPRRGVGTKTLQTIEGLAQARDIPLLEALGSLIAENKGRAMTAQRRFCHLLYDMQEKAPGQDVALSLREILDKSGYMEQLHSSSSPLAPAKIENLEELLSAARNYADLESFLEETALSIDASREQGDDAVWLMTLHAAKGLEFDHVFLPGWEEELFPSARSRDELGERGIEEERRLAYVGITRARKSVTISHCARRFLYGRWQDRLPSDFLSLLCRKNTHFTSTATTGIAVSHPSPLQATVSPRPTVSYQPRSTASRQPLKAGHSRFKQGDRVLHQRFGIGEVVEVQGDKLSITFDGYVKTIMNSFVHHV